VGAYLFPMPVVLIGANVDSKPNFETLAYVGMVESKIPLIAISSYENHYTNRGIRENGTFSVNTPSEGMVEVTDYCGITSGKEVDKSEVFDVFYGDLKTAPMITNAPLNLECKVVKSIKIKEVVDIKEGHDFFIGKIEGAYADESYLTEELPDITKLKPFVYSRNKYWKVGEFIENAFTVGKNYKKE
ncbi:MAG: flavin reductase family protein, partial [Promethearchaeota archaeon]